MGRHIHAERIPPVCPPQWQINRKQRGLRSPLCYSHGKPRAKRAVVKTKLSRESRGPRYLISTTNKPFAITRNMKKRMKKVKTLSPIK